MANVIAQRNTGFQFGELFQALGAQLKDARARRVAYNRTYGELAGLTDRELADIGMSRCEIDRVAKQHANML
ncbi:MAG: DUF1127 domain-containing protein [Paracoccaceae bacterium]